jgi:hypothetical protein
MNISPSLLSKCKLAHLAVCVLWLLAWLIISHWRSKRYIPRILLALSELQSTATQNAAVLILMFYCEGLSVPNHSPISRFISCRLGSTAYSPYLELSFTSGSRLLYQQPEDAPWHGDRTSKQTNPVALVRKRTIPTERQPLVGEVRANFSG